MQDLQYIQKREPAMLLDAENLLFPEFNVKLAQRWEMNAFQTNGDMQW